MSSLYTHDHSIPIDLTCNAGLLERLQQNINGFSSVRITDSSSKRAAVALTIVDISNDDDTMSSEYVPHSQRDAALILTLRSSGLKSHSGQWALPGGKLEESESQIDAALRELKEEVGLVAGKDRVVGFLDDFETRSGYIMTPVVIWGGTGVSLSPDPDEVGAVHRIPLGEFLRPDAPILYGSGSHSQPILMMPVGNSSIAAPTGAILYQFAEVAMKGKHTRVSQYEQPAFAWS